jgi:hypothetical protein
MEKTNNNCAMMKDFIEVNTPEIIDQTLSNIDFMSDLILRESNFDSESKVACLLDLSDIKDDYRVLRDISVNYHNENKA